MGTLERIQRLEQVEQERLAKEQRLRQDRATALATPHGLDGYEHIARVPMAVLGIAWLVIAVVVLSVDLHGTVAEVLVGFLFVIWAIVLVEYAVRLVVAPDRRGYVARRRIEPAVVAVPALQPLRLFDLGRVSLIATEITLRTRAILRHRGLFRVLLAAAGLVFLGSWLVLLAERNAPGSNIRSYGSALWWGIVTMTTVGYGDRYPVTFLGRIVAVILMLVGIGLLGVITATVASFFVQEHTDANKDRIEATHVDLGAQLGALDERLARIEVLLGGAAAASPAPSPLPPSPPPPPGRGTIQP